MPNAYDANADLNQRARALLHVNCSVCHVSDGGGNARFQVRYDLNNQDLKLIDEPPIHGDFELDDGRLVQAGDPYASVLFYRLVQNRTRTDATRRFANLDTQGIRIDSRMDSSRCAAARRLPDITSNSSRRRRIAHRHIERFSLVPVANSTTVVLHRTAP